MRNSVTHQLPPVVHPGGIFENSPAFQCWMCVFRGVGLASVLGCMFLGATRSSAADANANPITREDVQAAEALFGLEFSEAKEDMLLPGLKEQLDNYLTIRKFPLSNSVPPALSFNPVPVGMKLPTGRSSF